MYGIFISKDLQTLATEKTDADTGKYWKLIYTAQPVDPKSAK